MWLYVRMHLIFGNIHEVFRGKRAYFPLTLRVVKEKIIHTHTHHTHNDKANEQNVNNWWTRVPFIILATVYKFSIVANILIF